MISRFASGAACLALGASALTPGLALAQSSPRSTIKTESLEEVIVTGSKLKRPDAQAPIPVTSINANDIDVSGVTMISDYIRELPVFGINAGRTTETSGADSAKPLSTAGTERLNLRDLGVDRTLVVVDGRRHVGSTAGSTAVDVGSIPTALIERVEISTGGASTAYGADAIAGVVNFIMKKNFEGVQVDTKYGDSDEGGAENTYIALTVGGNFAENRGNAVFSASYNDIGGIRGQQRKYVTDRWGFVPNEADTGPNDGIPSTILRRDTRFTNLITSQGATIGLIDGSLLTFNDDSTSRPFVFGDPASGLVDSVVGGDGVDMVTNAHVATPLQRKSIFGSVNYALTDKVNFFAEGKAYLSDAQVISPPLLDAVTYPENGELFFLQRGQPVPVADRHGDPAAAGEQLRPGHDDPLERRLSAALRGHPAHAEPLHHRRRRRHRLQRLAFRSLRPVRPHQRRVPRVQQPRSAPLPAVDRFDDGCRRHHRRRAGLAGVPLHAQRISWREVRPTPISWTASRSISWAASTRARSRSTIS